jgi:hypothetical protein
MIRLCDPCSSSQPLVYSWPHSPGKAAGGGAADTHDGHLLHLLAPAASASSECVWLTDKKG